MKKDERLYNVANPKYRRQFKHGLRQLCLSLLKTTRRWFRISSATDKELW